MNDDKNSVNNFNIWNYKPWWCQPWSIIITGISIVGSSWLLLHLAWLSIIVAFLISIWWLYFLIIYPRAIEKVYRQQKD